MNITRENMIAGLAEDLEPVRRITAQSGALLVAFSAVIAFGVSVAMYDFWFGMFEGKASAFFWVTNGMLLLLGGASAMAMVRGGSPRVGQQQSAPGWAVAMISVLPLAAIIALFTGEANHLHEGLNDPVALFCLRPSLAAALLVGTASVMWLRRTAPVSIERSAWLVGIASGAFGTVAYGITCPLDTVSHLGLWHVAPVAISAVVARIVVPPMIRW